MGWEGEGGVGRKGEGREEGPTERWKLLRNRTYTYIDIKTWMYICTYDICTKLYVCLQYIYMYIYLYICVYICMYIYVYIYTYIYMHIYVYIYIYKHMYIHEYVCICI